jgi:hypothetical protein
VKAMVPARSLSARDAVASVVCAAWMSEELPAALRSRVSSSRMRITPPSEPLTAAGLVLRLPTENDIDALVRFGDDPDRAETLWVPIPTPCSRAEAQARLQEFSEG